MLKIARKYIIGCPICDKTQKPKENRINRRRENRAWKKDQS